MNSSELQQALSEAADRVVIVAPFIKVAALRRLLGAIAERQLTVYTRWLPSEVALGVSDLEVFDLVEGEWGGELWLLRELHAKAFVADDRLFVGSANVTASALGWSSQPNLELITQVADDNSAVADLLCDLENYALRATSEFQAEIRRSALALQEDPQKLLEWSATPSGLPDLPLPTQASESCGDARPWSRLPDASQKLWIPTTNDPDRFVAYHTGTGRFALEESAAGAERDLRFLQVRPTSSRPAFVAGVIAALAQVTVVRLVRDVLDHGGDEQAAYEAFCNAVGLVVGDEVSNDQWTTMVNWLLHFLPEEFDYRSTGEALTKRQGRSALGEYG